MRKFYYNDGKEIKVGDLVTITDSEYQYTDYKKFIKMYRPDIADKFVRDVNLANNSIGKVVCVGCHEYFIRTLVGVEVDGNVYVIDVKGIEKVKGKEVIVITREGSNTVVRHKIGKQVVNSASATCLKKDTFDLVTGSVIALSRLANGSFKAAVSELTESNTYKEVKRKAIPGEYVKIVNSSEDNSNQYENGDILKIISVDRYENVYYADGYSDYLFDYEYVVLDGYNPNEKQEKVYTKDGLQDVIRSLFRELSENYEIK